LNTHNISFNFTLPAPERNIKFLFILFYFVYSVAVNTRFWYHGTHKQTQTNHKERKMKENEKDLKGKLHFIRKEHTTALGIRNQICTEIAEVHHNLWIEGIEKGKKTIIGVVSHISVRLEQLHYDLVEADNDYKNKKKSWIDACNYFCEKRYSVV
jgi:hypothetical protein